MSSSGFSSHSSSSCSQTNDCSIYKQTKKNDDVCYLTNEIITDGKNQRTYLSMFSNLKVQFRTISFMIEQIINICDKYINAPFFIYYNSTTPEQTYHQLIYNHYYYYFILLTSLCAHCQCALYSLDTPLFSSSRWSNIRIQNYNGKLIMDYTPSIIEMKTGLTNFTYHIQTELNRVENFLSNNFFDDLHSNNNITTTNKKKERSKNNTTHLDTLRNDSEMTLLNNFLYLIKYTKLYQGEYYKVINVLEFIELNTVIKC